MRWADGRTNAHRTSLNVFLASERPARVARQVRSRCRYGIASLLRWAEQGLHACMPEGFSKAGAIRLCRRPTIRGPGAIDSLAWVCIMGLVTDPPSPVSMPVNQSSLVTMHFHDAELRRARMAVCRTSSHRALPTLDPVQEPCAAHRRIWPSGTL